MEQLFLIDGNSLINRAYFAMPPLNNSKGQPTNAVLGFVNMLVKIINENQPKSIAVAFDLKAPTFRHKMYDGYKATRKGMPDDLAVQMPILKNLLDIMKISVLQCEGLEADDIIGIVSKQSKNTVILTGDRDMLQLIDKHTTVWLTKRGITDIQEVNLDNIQELYGLLPDQIVDYKALRGDTSDNIPGVNGIGEKGALDLIKKYNSLENIYAHIDEIKGSLHDKLSSGRDMAFLSRTLAQIVTDQSLLHCNVGDLTLQPFGSQVKTALTELEFKSVLARINFLNDAPVKQNCQVDFVEINDQQQLDAVINTLKSGSKLAVHIDKNIHLAVDENTEYVIKISDNFLSGFMGIETALKAVSAVLSAPTKKVLYDSKAFRHIVAAHNIEIAECIDDISIVSYVLAKTAAYNTLDSLLEFYGYPTNSYATALFRLHGSLLGNLAQQGVEQLYSQIELPLSKILYETEKNGFLVDCEIWEQLRQKYSDIVAELTQRIYGYADQTFNINSTKQLAQILFEKLKLPHSRKTKTGYSTDSDVLETLKGRHEIIDDIIKYRQISKLSSTYIDGIKQYIDDNTSRVHTTFKQTSTSTGRLSSVDPNLQNIPIREEEGREIRKMFVADKGNVLVSADYSQIELRLLAHFSQNPRLLNAYKNGEDIHTLTASQVFGVQQEMVTSSMRRSAKAVNFGIIYGISDFGLASDLGIPVPRAREYIEKYFATYSGVKEYMQSCVETVRKQGYITTISGRKRYIPEINSPNKNISQFGERAAMNMPLQGSAADIIKIAMINVYNAFLKHNLKSKMILQVHDELIVEAPTDEQQIVEQILRDEMQNAVKLNVPLTVDVSAGCNWFDI